MFSASVKLANVAGQKLMYPEIGLWYTMKNNIT